MPKLTLNAMGQNAGGHRRVLARSARVGMQTPEGSEEDELLREQDTERSDANDPIVPTSFERRATAIRVVNASAEVRSRYTSCSGAYALGIRPAAVDAPSRQPTCSKIDCTTLDPDEILTPMTECSAPACADGRLDLAPGEADAEYDWDGVFLTLTERNCYDSTTFEAGTPMLARVCFGKPGASDYDMQDYTCTEYPFAYGAPVLEVELQ
jgi:hypothetical protein